VDLCQKPSVELTSIELIFAAELSLQLLAKMEANDPARVKTPIQNLSRVCAEFASREN
jgi:hypothetical protein